jgi:hypothetical protein
LPSGRSEAVMVTTSENATVIPPPVNGCLMLNASPNNTAPGVRFGDAGMVLLRMDLNWPFATARRSGSRNFSGTCGTFFGKEKCQSIWWACIRRVYWTM